MNRFSNQILVFSGLLISILLGSLFIENPTFYIAMLLLMLVIGIISMLVRTMYAYALLITVVLIIAFYNVGNSWIWQWDTDQQAINILTQAIITFGAIMSWMSGYAIQKNAQLLQALRKENTLLKKYEEFEGILTFNEFLEQAEILFTGMIRRKEKGYFLHFAIIEDEEYKLRVLRDKISEALIDSIRTKFDLIGQLTSSSLLLYLNNTSDKGVEIVLQRVEEKFQKAGIGNNLYDIQVAPIPEEWTETLKEIHFFKKKGVEG